MYAITSLIQRIDTDTDIDEIIYLNDIETILIQNLKECKDYSITMLSLNTIFSTLSKTGQLKVMVDRFNKNGSLLAIKNL